MPRGVFNWTFSDVTKFLKANGFQLINVEGSHYFYSKHDGVQRIVTVPFHGKQAIKPRTMKGIMLQSGIPRSQWLNK